MPTPADHPSLPADPQLWARRWLLAAGLYNLAWGAVVVAAPDLPLSLFGVDPLVGTGRAIWQCLGMVIGVYGIGYLAASLDPLRHWPIVLVGFLGKVFGPIGFAWCASRGEIDWRFGLTIPTNDLVWWIPFFMMLRASWLHAVHGDGATRTVGSALCIARDQSGCTLAHLSQERPVLLVAVRHFGCTFCREDLAELAGRRAALERDGARVAILHRGTHAEAERFLAAAGLGDMPAFADPDGSIARALGLRHGTFLELLGPRNWFRATRSLLRGHGVGFPVGDPFLLPGAFLIAGGKVRKHILGDFAGARPDLGALTCDARLAPDARPAHT
jgi:hypothetical protein